LVCLKPLQGVELCLLGAIQVRPARGPEYICDEPRGKYREPTEFRDGKTGKGYSTLGASHSSRPKGRSTLASPWA
jgi:hypothetical protein